VIVVPTAWSTGGFSLMFSAVGPADANHVEFLIHHHY
jgi:hypothetical protein